MNQDQEIARIAYELFLMRGGVPGDPVADWVTAERLYAQQKQTETVNIVEERIVADNTFEVKPVMVEEEARVAEKPAARVRTAAPKKEAAPRKSTKKAEMKAEPVKEEKKVVEEPAVKKTTRKKAAK